MVKGLRIVAILLMIASPWSASASYQAYFNHDEASSYQDPYRKIKRIGKNFEAIIVSFIDSAKTNVDVAVQDIDLPLVAKALVRAKQERGVKVRFIMENIYNADLENLTSLKRLNRNDPNADEIIDYMKGKENELMNFIDTNRDGVLQASERAERDARYILKAGKIPLIDDTNDESVGSSLMHHKFIIVDDEKLIVTSANFTLSDVHGDFAFPNSVGNNNALMVFDNKTLTKQFVEEFAIMWGNGRIGASKFGLNKPYRGLKALGNQGSQILVQFSPTSKRIPFEESTNGNIVKRILNAKKRVLLDLFVFSDQNISNALNDRNQKKVPIEVLVDRNFAYRNYSELLDIFGVKMLSSESCSYEEGNRVWDTPNPSIGGSPNLTPYDKNHHKFAVIDNTVIFGSHNWSPSANFANDETLLIIENEEIANLFAQEHKRIRKNAIMGLPLEVKKNISHIKEQCHSIGPSLSFLPTTKVEPLYLE